VLGFSREARCQPTHGELTRNRTAGPRCAVVPSAGRTDGSFSTVFVRACSSFRDSYGTHAHAHELTRGLGSIPCTPYEIGRPAVIRRGRRAFAGPSVRRADKNERDGNGAAQTTGTELRVVSPADGVRCVRTESARRTAPSGCKVTRRRAASGRCWWWQRCRAAVPM